MLKNGYKYLILSALWISQTHPAAEPLAPKYAISQQHLKEAITPIWEKLTLISMEQYRTEPDTLLQQASTIIADAIKNTNFDKAIQPYTPENVKDLKAILAFQLQEAFEFDIVKLKKPLAWCPCVPAIDRIALATQMINDIRTKFPDTKQKIIFTALASGRLLQEYLTLAPLIKQGYNNITLNIIDLVYPDPILLQRLLTHAEKPTLNEAFPLFEKYGKELNDSTLFPEFERIKRSWTGSYQVAAEKLKTALPSLTIHQFQDLDKYISLVKQNADLKSNIVTLVDPGTEYIKLPVLYPSNGNIIGLTLNNKVGVQAGQAEPDLFIVPSKNAPVQIYVKDPTNNKLVTYLDRLARATKTHVDPEKTPAFIAHVMRSFSTYEPREMLQYLETAYVKILSLDFSNDDAVEDAIELMQTTRQLIKPYLASIKKYASLAISKRAEDWQTYSLEYADKTLPILISVFHQFERQLTPEITVRWYADPYIALQQLASTAKDDALIYLLCSLHEGKIHSAKETKAELLNQDLFAKTTATLLEQLKYKPLTFSREEKNIGTPPLYYDSKEADKNQ